MTVSTEGAEKANLEKPKNEETKAKTNRRLAQLSLAALGVVFGDIATSPGGGNAKSGRITLGFARIR
jgi:hypothetical protein